MMRLTRNTATVLLATAAMPAAAADDEAGTILLDIRARYEAVEQDGKLDAEAATLRTRLGWQSPQWAGFTVLLEGESVIALGSDTYNSGLNGQTAYASIKDDDVTELNRLQVSYAASEHARITVGRQLLSFDGNRFVGSPSWRQDRNSHDAVRVDLSQDGWRASYVYHDRVLRGPGDDFDWDSDSHLVNLGYTINDSAELTGFAYFIDLTDPAAPQDRSNMTWGGRLTGSVPLGEARLSYAAMLARQSDYGSSTADFELGFASFDVRVSGAGGTLLFGYDVLDGDGSNTIATPLGSGHSFHGWADAFSGGGAQSTVDGLEDLRFGGSYEGTLEAGFLSGWEIGAVHRDFSSQRNGDDLGREWDAWLNFDLPGNVGLSFQFADYRGGSSPLSPADRTKQWVVLTYSR
ncbi:hypothetical protein AWH62_01815 [Maricaulis sp. W15]|uniref:Alginate export protein n=1 Tax=Maricaulis maris TaxID=74318 RepID=A0A495DLN7_9PROT|nr:MULTISPECIES: alginate export family protein [Maricaulis]OLF81431.1 hypothetical protein AWH62_01815 [Maricaulis sp. W15]RKR03834.1 alginate export protein [Maricaulis maris]